ncbi:MAG: PD-(D/E)XK nuclease family protein [Planctomycetota bacterium]|jgi:ATP-dependent helicase/DNAse subunit B
MPDVQIIRLGVGDDVTDYIVERLSAAVASVPALDTNPCVFVSGVERRARGIEERVGSSFLRGTPERISRELLKEFMPQLQMRGNVERDFDFFGALSSTLSQQGIKRRASRALVEQLIEARKRLAENYSPDARNDKALNDLGSRGRLLAGVLESYSTRLSETGTVDPEDTPWVAADHMSQWQSFSPSLLVIEELAQLRPARAKFLQALIAKSAQTLLVTREGIPFSQDATGLLLDALPSDPVQVETTPATAKFQKEAIAVLADSATLKKTSDGLVIRKSFSRASEVRDTAQEIKQAVLAGISPADIAVVGPSMGVYDALIQDTFIAAGIPFDSASSTSIDLVQTVAPILDLIRCARNGLDRLELLDALASPYLRFEAESDVSRIEWLSQLEAVTREANIVGGRNLKADWLDKLNTQDDDDSAELKKRLARLLDLLKSFTNSSSKAGKFVTSVNDLVVAAGIDSVIEDERPDESLTMRSEALFRFSKLLSDLSAEFTAVGNPTLKCSELFQALLEQCRIHEVRRPEQHEDRVQVFGLRELQMSKFEQVFVLGLTDLDLPLSDSDCMFFPPLRDTVVEETFGEFAQNLHTPIDTSRQADHLYVHALLAAKSRLVLSMPESDGDTPMVPAVIHARMMSLAGVDSVRNLESAPRPIPINSTELASETASQLSSDKKTTAKLELSSALKIGLHGRVVDLSRHDEAASPGQYGGQVETFPQLKKKFGLSGDDRHVFSPSQIDLYASCPMRFWFRYVLRIKKEDDPTLEPPASEIGTFVHAVFERFIWLLRDEAGEPATVDDPQKRVAVSLLTLAGSKTTAEKLGTRLLRSAFKQTQKTMATEGPYWRGTMQCLESGLLGKDGTLGRGALKSFLDEELARCEQDIACKFVEFTFGKSVGEDECRDSVAENLELQLPGGSIVLQGSVDRVDEGPDGLEIVDYKTGKDKTRSDIVKGKAFQLPTYLAAIAAKVETEPAGMSYLKAPLFKPFKRNDIVNGNSPNAKKLDVPDVVNRLLPIRLQQMLTAIGNGVFIHVPFENLNTACNYCEYSSACAKEESLLMDRQSRMDNLVPDAYVAGEVPIESGGEE